MSYSLSVYFLILARRTVCCPPLEAVRTSRPSNCLDLTTCHECYFPIANISPSKYKYLSLDDCWWPHVLILARAELTIGSHAPTKHWEFSKCSGWYFTFCRTRQLIPAQGSRCGAASKWFSTWKWQVYNIPPLDSPEAGALPGHGVTHGGAARHHPTLTRHAANLRHLETWFLESKWIRESM